MSDCKSEKPYEGPVYKARHTDKHSSSILITAAGKNRTGGWRTHFEIEPTFAPPLRLRFVNCPPPGVANDLITPFEVHISITSIPHQKEVTIDDTEGSHKVKISEFHTK